ncbi:MAG: hypothetical protein O7G86_17530 [Gammaproteobacteria bacterium]|nr:hypothetical protein [Gammaproteobacteria bacterium]
MSDTTTPMACSLDAETLTNRRLLFREKLLPQALHKTRIDNGLCVVFPRNPMVRDELQAFITLERQCCGFLDFELSEDLDHSQLLLNITGPLEAQAVVDQMESIFNDIEDPAIVTLEGRLTLAEVRRP